MLESVVGVNRLVTTRAKGNAINRPEEAKAMDFHRKGVEGGESW